MLTLTIKMLMIHIDCSIAKWLIDFLYIQIFENNACKSPH